MSNKHHDKRPYKISDRLFPLRKPVTNAIRRLSCLAVCLPLMITQVTSYIYAQDDSPLQSQEENPQSSPATEPDSSVPSVESTETSEQPEPVLDPSDSENLIYTLTIEHVVNYQSDGVDQTRSVLEIVELVDSDFTDGQIDLSRFVQNQPGLQAVQIGRISISDFDENRQAQTRIVYRPASGWAVKKRQSAANGVEAGGIFEGDFSDVLFVPITQVSINVNFEYSKTGGMAGHSVWILSRSMYSR